MPDEPTAETTGPGEEQTRARPRSGSRWWWLPIGVLVAGALVAGGFALWWGKDARTADAADRDRSAAATVAGQFALRMDKVDGTDFNSYIKSVNQLLTTKAKAKNDQTFKVLGQTYAAAKVKGTGKLVLTGVASSDADSATVLVVHDASVTTTQGDVEHHYRWTVDVVKVKGRWLVDDFNPVN